jgi:hypothetical protein
MKLYDAELMSRYHMNESQPKEPIYRTPLISLSNLTDKEGLDKAYARADNIYLHGDTFYVAGTQYWRDVYDDITQIPFDQTFRAQNA